MAIEPCRLLSPRRLSRSDRQAVLDILRETKTDLPDYWRTNSE